MIVHYPNMTGNELRSIYYAAKSKTKMTQEKFAELVMPADSQTRSALINQFARGAEAIDSEVEKAVKNKSELAQFRTLVVHEQNDEQNTSGSEVVKFLTDTIQVLKDVLIKGEKQSEAIIESNKHIREEAALYRRMLMDGYEAGLLQWNSGKPKKTA